MRSACQVPDMAHEGPERSRRNRSVAGVVCALSIAFLQQPALASAAATLSVSVTVGPPTTLAVATGAGFAPSERVALGFDHRVLDTVKAASAGTFAERVEVPATA